MTDRNKNIDEESEIDLLELGHKLWEKRIFILKASLVGLIIGVIIAFSIPKEYMSTVVFTAESSKAKGGNMSALASMAGINLGSAMSSDVFAPELYPEVLRSTPFIQSLLKINVSDKKQGINTTLYDYIKDDQKSAWWNYIVKAPGALLSLFSKEDSEDETINNDSRFISQEEMKIINSLKNSYSISTDKKAGITTIEVAMQSPEISAFLADTLTSYLQTYIIEKRTQKARTDLQNSEKLYEKAKADYYKAQQNLASFVDGNLNVISAKFRTHQDRLQNEANLAYSVYTQMAQQVQLDKVKVQDETPVFTIIQPAIEPLYSEKPKKKMIVAGLVFLGLASACGWVLRKDIVIIFK